jgi:hypothetical protein
MSLLFLFIGFGILAVPRNWLPETINHPTFYGFLLFLSAAIIYLPPLILRHRKTERKERLVTNMQSAIAFSLLLNNAGEFGLFGLYQYGFQYDKFCHFLVCMILAFILAESLRAWERLSFWKISWMTFTAVLLSGLAWELFEFSSDLFFNTAEWGVYGRNVIADTVLDIVFDILGAVAGIVVFLIPSKWKIRKRKRQEISF